MQMAIKRPPEANGHPREGTFSTPDVARLFDLPESRLRYWSQTGFVSPSVRRGGRMFYTFRDLIAVKVAADLLAAGLPLQRVRRSLDALRLSLPADAPLSHLRIRCDHDRVLVDHSEGTFEAATGQLLLDFEVASLRQQVSDVLALPWVDDQSTDLSAYEHFLKGCEHERQWSRDTDDAPELAAARAAYQSALELDPTLAAAWTNLGTTFADTDDLDTARDHFERALRCDPDQPEARANLAELALRAGNADVAIAGYRELLRAAPEYRDAHYGLARALLAVGGKGQALAHLERFCAAVEVVPKPQREASLERRRSSAQDVIEALREELARRSG